MPARGTRRVRHSTLNSLSLWRPRFEELLAWLEETEEVFVCVALVVVVVVVTISLLDTVTHATNWGTFKNWSALVVLERLAVQAFKLVNMRSTRDVGDELIF